MGDSIVPTRNADLQPSRRRDPSSLLHTHSNGGPNNGEDEPYTIKCICGFADDTYDGNTVFCDRCNTWQHIACYYYPETTLEDEFEHNCIDCKPSQRPRLDNAAAKSRQRVLRHPQDPSDERKAKRPGPKSHKKTKPREVNGNAPQTNGWMRNDAHTVDVRGESPRDHGPPNKRPKTSHRYSSSTNNLTSRPSEARNRSGSNASLISQEQMRLPLKDCPPDFLSPDFIRVHHENTQFHHAQANLHLNIEITDLLMSWLDDQDSFYEATNGRNHNEVFQHFPQPIEELEQPIEKHVRIDSDVKFHGEHPIWPFLTVATDLVAGDYVGELRGLIGRTGEYIHDEGNQWSKLRHPDHFVFFHPHLPIYIDSRLEGTELRYARRSCQPNLKMETIITGSREYRFCFTASDDIPRDTEITIPWDTRCDPQLYRILDKVKTATSESDLQSVSQWVGNLLAHFGGCACEQQTGSGLCLLAHFDRRLSHLRGEPTSRNTKARKSLQANKLSPPHAGKPNNSRASSGGPSHTDMDEDIDVEDDRSQSRSSDNKSSRGTTPLRHGRDDALAEIGGISEREKRKVLQSVKLFERLDSSQSNRAGQLPGHKKKKRGSGSNAHTPTTATHRSNVHIGRESAPGTPDALIKGNSDHGSDRTITKGARARTPTMLRPIYCNALVQTEVPEVSVAKFAPPASQVCLPRSTQIQKRSLLRNYQRSQPRAPGSVQGAIIHEPSHAPPPASIDSSEHILPVTSTPVDQDQQESQGDQLDRTSLNAPSLPKPVMSTERLPDVKEASHSPSTLAHPPLKPPPPPWTAKLSPMMEPQVSRQRSNEVLESRLTLDVRPVRIPRSAILTESPVEHPKAANAGAPADATSEALQTADCSPAGQIPSNDLLTAKTSPVKKKMSLSAYMSKRKTEAPLFERTQSQGHSMLSASHRANSSDREGPDPG